MPISKRVRFEVLKRDGFRCRYCGATPAETELHVDDQLAACRHYRDHVWASFTGPDDEPLPLPDDWRDSIRRFLSLGLDMTDLEEFTRTAMANRKIPNGRVFSYVCGIAWNVLRDMQAEALEGDR